MEFVKPPDAFSFEEPNAPQRWARWEKQFNTYFVAAELSGKTQEVQVARLLNAAGPEAQEVHELFVYDNEDDKKDYKKILKKFAEYCRPKKMLVYERYRFWKRAQKEGEPFDSWFKDLRIIAKDCEFAEEDNMIRDMIVFYVFDKKVQERMLRKSDLTLKDAMDACRAAESSQSQLAEIRQENVTSISEVGTGPGTRKKCFHCNVTGHIAQDCPSREERKEVKEFQCFNCQGFGHRSRECPSGDSYPQRKRKKSRGGRGRGRGRGGGRGGRYGANSMHEVTETEEEEYAQEFSALSLSALRVTTPADSPDDSPAEDVVAEEGVDSKPVLVEEMETKPIRRNALQVYSQDFEESVSSLDTLCVSSVSESVKKRYVKFRFYDIMLGKSTLAELKIDSGAEANVIPLKVYRRLFPERFREDGSPISRFIRKSTRSLEAYGGVTVPHLGTVNLPCEYNGKKFMCRLRYCDMRY